ncbi:hypothetical protein [uncultured Rikenella sp.]|uniref:hypothetical protein n=1 Tax=uncultured Rikenella sp. TaxID=368003 RepID=UPI0025EE1E4F|nr:hypothetical protein [uncultured Rikenella sp.]
MSVGIFPSTFFQWLSVCSRSPRAVEGVVAPGYRGGNEGLLWGGGGLGYGWASGTSGIDGGHLLFYMQGLDPSSSYNRVYGFQLRCLSE